MRRRHINLNYKIVHHEFEFPTYLVGGAVRDFIIGKESSDLDFCVVCPSFESMRDMLLKDSCEIFIEKPEYLTIRCHHPKFGAVDFAVARKDGDYSDQRRPDEVFLANDIVSDLSRRDFKMNAIAINMASLSITDPFGGQRDIENGIISCVGKAIDRLHEDKLRILRALRLKITLGFDLDNELEYAISKHDTVCGLKSVSVERIREELAKMFNYSTLDSLKTMESYPLVRDIAFDKIKLIPTLKSKIA